MTRIAIIGGKLQGLEAVYLASKAGMETVLIDKRDRPIAKNLCNHFICCDVLDKDDNMIEELKKADFILPALEDEEVLIVLSKLAEEYNLNLAFDLMAYSISSSKILSDKLMSEHGIPAPKYYPSCRAPYIVKPSNLSGSEGVRYIDTAIEMETFLASRPPNEQWVAQEFLTGRSYSIEIIGEPGNYKTYEITEIHMDQAYDCKRVTAPCNIPEDMKKDFENIATRLATILKLKGVMDVEAIDDHGKLKVLEIDARIPSQTPIVVYHTTGINQVEELGAMFGRKKLNRAYWENKKRVSFEHLLIEAGRIMVQGEHIMSEAGPLSLMPNFCGADEVLTNYQYGDISWRGTFINIADNEQQLDMKRKNMLKEINLLQGEELEYYDLSPSDQ